MDKLLHLSRTAVTLDKFARLLLHDAEHNDLDESTWRRTDDSSSPFEHHLGRHSSN